MRFRLEGNPEDWEACYNVGIGMRMPTVVKNSPNHIEIMKWGLIPSWAKDPKIGYSTANARGETVDTKPAFRSAFKSRRCIIPASGFYEWKHVGEGKQMEKLPYYFTVAGEEMFGFAGLYETWKDTEGVELKTYTIITTEPNTLMVPVHDRMPVILKPENEEEWLDNTNFDEERLKAMLVPYPSEKMERVRVSTAVNKLQENKEELIRPLGDDK
jgi:putative SOS response-associated peptidase YedK